MHSTNWGDGEKKEGRKLYSSKNNSMEDLLGNEENGYPDLDLTKTIIVTNEPSDFHKKNPIKRKSWKRSMRNQWRTYKIQLAGKYKKHSRSFKTPQINLRRHRNN
jgi:hypothetical protein